MHRYMHRRAPAKGPNAADVGKWFLRKVQFSTTIPGTGETNEIK